MEFHRQCKLEKSGTFTVSWIPERFARVGNVLKLGGEDGWVVREVWAREETDFLLFHERDHRTCFHSLNR